MASSRRTATNENVSTYDSGGGKDYSALATWEAATDIDLVSATQSEVLECYKGVHNNYDLIDGATVNSSYYRIIRPASGEGHSGIPKGDGSHVEFATSADVPVIRIDENYSSCEDLVLKLTNNSSNNKLPLGTGSNVDQVRFIGCIIYDSLNSGSGLARGFYMQATNAAADIFAINCLSHNNEADGFIGVGLGTKHHFNCTAIGNGLYGFNEAAGAVVCKNCGANGNSSGEFTAGVSQTDCSSSAPTFEDSGNDDFHLASGDTTWKDQGGDLSADGDYAFDDDINDGVMGAAKAGETRSGTWDIGFDEYVAAGITQHQESIAGALSFAGADTKKLSAKRSIAGVL